MFTNMTTFQGHVAYKHAEHHKYCQECKKNNQSLFLCGECKQAVYCGKECQERDWEHHNCHQQQQLVGDFIDELPAGVYATLFQYLGRDDVKNLRLVLELAGRTLGYAWISAVQFPFMVSMDDLRAFPLGSRSYFRRITVISNIQSQADLEFIRDQYPNLVDLQIRRLFTLPLDTLNIVAYALIYLNLSSYMGDSIDVLCNLKKLQLLYLNSYRGDSIDALRNLTRLQRLNLNRYTGDSIDALRNLTQLQWLWLSRYTGDSIDALRNLKQLRRLDLWRYTGDSIDALRNLTQLQWLVLSSYTGDSIDALRNLTQLRTLDLTGYPNQHAVREIKRLLQI